MKKEIFGINIWLFILLVLLVLFGLFSTALALYNVTESTKFCEENGMVFEDWDSLTVTCLEFDDDSGLVEERRFRR